MSGLAGFMAAGGLRGAKPGLLDRLIAALGHRGPDGVGRQEGAETAIACARLATLDLATGDQPLYDAQGAALVVDGGFSNDQDLRNELGARRFATGSDCEALLPLYRDLGLDAVARLRGGFAFALSDPGEGRLILGRDPFGVRPLYYVERDDMFVFASEPRALLAAGVVAPRMRRGKAVELLQLQFTTGRETIFEGIERVLPGETLVVQRGRVVARRRDAALVAPRLERWREDEALARLDAQLGEAVAAHSRADQNLALFHSGGLSSTALMVAYRRWSGERPRAWMAAYPGDAPGIDPAARALDAEMAHVAVDEAGFWAALPKVVESLDDPVADYTAAPLYLTAAVAAAEAGVALTGEGGAEIFAAHGRYRSALRPIWLGGRTMRARGFFEGLGVLRDEGRGWRDGVAATERRLEAEWAEAKGRATRLQRAQAADLADWLPHDLLTRLDRMATAHSLEARAPLIDLELARTVYLMGDGLKIRRGLGRWILRRWLAIHLPEARPFEARPRAPSPIPDWIAARGRELGPLLAADEGVLELCQGDGVAAMFEALASARPGARISGARRRRVAIAGWILLFYALWRRRFIVGQDIAGDPAEVLAG